MVRNHILVYLTVIDMAIEVFASISLLENNITSIFFIDKNGLNSISGHLLFFLDGIPLAIKVSVIAYIPLLKITFTNILLTTSVCSRVTTIFPLF